MSSKLQILFLCHRFPYPPNKGDKIRAFQQLRALSRRHEVDVFTLADDPADLDYRAALQQHCRSLTVEPLSPRRARARSIAYLPTRIPLSIPYFWSSRLGAEVRGALAARNYDRIFIYCSSVVQYIPWLAGTAPAPSDAPPVILDLVDVDSDKWAQYASASKPPMSWVYARESRNLERYERHVSERAACVLVATEREASLARRIAPRARVHVITNGVDAEFFAPREKNAQSEAAAVVFTGDMSYFPNQEAAIFFARQVLPRVRQECPATRFLVVGRNPGPSVLALRDISGVEVTGAVPDIRPWLAQASVAATPLTIAAGIQNKILESMASGLPVVSTVRAARALTDPVRRLIEVGETAEQLAGGVVRLLRNPELARQRGLEGRREVIKSYNWHTSLQSLLEIVENPISPASAGEQTSLVASA